MMKKQIVKYIKTFLEKDVFYALSAVYVLLVLAGISLILFRLDLETAYHLQEVRDYFIRTHIITTFSIVFSIYFGSKFLPQNPPAAINCLMVPLWVINAAFFFAPY